MLLFERFGQHQPLNRQAERYAREGVDLSLSTLADQLGAAAAALIKAHVMAAERLHGDDTTAPVLAKGRTRTGRLWAYVRDDRPFAGRAPVALGRRAWLFAGSDRGGDRAAFLFTLIGTAKPNDVDPQAWLACVLARIADTSRSRLGELLPWEWARRRADVATAIAA